MKKTEENKTVLKIKEELLENEVIKKLLEEYPIDNILEFNEFTIKEKLQDNAYLQEHFRLIYISECQKLNKIEDKFAQKTGELYDKHKYGPKDLSKSEIERYYLPVEPELIKFKRMIDLQKIKTEYFSAIIKSLEAQNYNMGTFTKNLICQ
jgi:hypothetical protein